MSDDYDPFDIDGGVSELPPLNHIGFKKCIECGDLFRGYPANKTICGHPQCVATRDKRIREVREAKNGKVKKPLVRRRCKECSTRFLPKTRGQWFCKRDVCVLNRKAKKSKARRKRDPGKPRNLTNKTD